MNFIAQNIPYKSTGFFSKLVVDYISQDEKLQPFYSFAPAIDGLKKAIEQRKNFAGNRQALVNTLQKLYTTIATSELVKTNINNLLLDNTFTITTAHQPNIFTGQLYFIYKILHAIKLAEECKRQMPENNFVPVYFMGSEDADLEELGHVYINGNKHEWKTNQTGAVGRMKVDKALMKMLDTIAGEIIVQPYGSEIIEVMKTCYTEGTTVEQATFKLVNHLFEHYGLVVLLPDDVDYKKIFLPVVEKELKEQFSYPLVEATVSSFPKEYKVQAGGRELNLFYLKDNIRERIVKAQSKFSIQNSTLEFNEKGIYNELNSNPERFSPNVILRPVFQETILPNIAFIGGGGELAYWLELKKVFEAVNVPYPVLVLRNSFLVVEKKYTGKRNALNLTVTEYFKNEQNLLKEITKNESALQLSLDNEKKLLMDIYEKIKSISGTIDITLSKHTEALQVKALQKIAILEKKMLKAETKKFEVKQRQLHYLISALFPNNNLQERIENVMPFYAKWGKGFIKLLLENSLVLQQQFVILEEQ